MARGPMLDSPFRDDADKRRQGGDLRDLVRATCDDCAYDWSAPIVYRCPRCHNTNITITDRAMMNAKRV